MPKRILIFALCFGAAAVCPAETTDSVSTDNRSLPLLSMPRISGTVRAKYEYQTSEGESRFQVRNARVAITGTVVSFVDYKAEIDLSDQGEIKMLDAYAGVRPLEGLELRIGQMRVPYSIDAHRSPHQQYFANRSFIAKQVGNTRDVGFYVGYKFRDLPLVVQGGVFNGSGLTNQKNFWTSSPNFSAKATWALACGLTLQASVQKLSPSSGAAWLYNGGLTLERGRWIAEVEVMRKEYRCGVFPGVTALDAFAGYRLPLRRVAKGISFLARFDYMTDHYDGDLTEEGSLPATPDDAARRRLTGGVTLHFGGKMQADLRLNYEQYFYDDISLAATSEKNKAVVEMMVHF